MRETNINTLGIAIQELFTTLGMYMSEELKSKLKIIKEWFRNGDFSSGNIMNEIELNEQDESIIRQELLQNSFYNQDRESYESEYHYNQRRGNSVNRDKGK